jgi:hypothetical protein
MSLYRCPRRQMLNPTIASMNDIHTKICTYLTESNQQQELDRYMMSYSTFIRQHSRPEDDERGKMRTLYITSIASEFMDQVEDISRAVQLIQQTNTRRVDTQCPCGGYLLSNAGHDVCERCGNTIARGDDSITSVPFGVVVESSRYPYRRAHHFTVSAFACITSPSSICQS